MTTPDGSPFGDAAEADVVEQSVPIDDTEDDPWRDAQRIGDDRGWQASEADLLEQATPVPDDDQEFDR